MTDDLIRRSDVLRYAREYGSEFNLEELEDLVNRIPSPLDADWRLYEKKSDDRSEYRYGPKWQMTALLVDGGYPTPEEAKAAWLRGLERR